MFVEPECILSDSGNWEMYNNECDPLALNTFEMPHLPDGKCKYCFKIFSKKRIANHLRTHYGSKQKKCVWKNEDGSICGKLFKRLDHLERHNRIHDGVKAHKCIQCLRAFSRKDYMKKHMLTHSETHSDIKSFNKPYSCEVCNKSFPGRNSLKKHFRTHPLVNELIEDLVDSKKKDERLPVINELVDDLVDGKKKNKRLRTSQVGFNQNYYYYY